jgi:Dihydrodipicolinate synthase/N-acetylneuraminate lyase
VLEAGGAGCISATANVTAALAAKVLAEWRANEAPAPVQDSLSELRTAFASLSTIPALKDILSEHLDAPEWATVRPPLAPLSDADRNHTKEIADRLDDEGLLRGLGG